MFMPDVSKNDIMSTVSLAPLTHYNKSTLTFSETQQSVMNIVPLKTLTLMSANGDDYADDATTTGVLPAGGTAVTGSIEMSGDRDWFAITVEAGQTWKFNLDAGSQSFFDTNLYLYSATGSYLSYNDDANSSLNSEIIYTFSSAGVYYLSAGPLSSSQTGEYSISANQLVDDFSADVNTTGRLNINSNVSGELNYSGDRDWFAITLSEDELIRFRTDQNVQLQLYDAAGNYAAYGQTSTNGISELIADGLAAGQYFIQVASYLPIDEYTIAVYQLSDDFAADNSTRGVLSFEEDAVGRLEYTNDNDWFAIEVEAGIAVEFVHTGRGEIESVRSETGQYINLNRDYTYSPTGESISYAQFEAAGTYYVSVSGYELGQYRVEASLTDDDYSNDSFSSALIDLTVFTEPVTFEGRIDYPSDEDWIILNLPADSIINLTIDTYDVDTSIRTLQGNYVYNVSTDVDFEADTSSLNFQTTEAVSYILSLASYYVKDYNIVVELSEDDFGETAEGAGSIILDGDTITATHEFIGDKDWFAIDLTAGATVEFSTPLDGLYNSPSLGLFTADGNGVEFSVFYENDSAGIRGSVTESGTYYLQAQANVVDGYSLTATTITDDFGNTRETATAITFGDSVTVTHDYSGDLDFLSLELTQGQVILLASDTYDGTFRVTGPDYFSESSTLLSNPNELVISVPETGTYYVELYGDNTNREFDYTFSTSVYTDDFTDDASTTGVIIPDGPTVRSLRDFHFDVDWFAFDVGADTTLRFYTGSQFNNIQIFNSDGEELNSWGPTLNGFDSSQIVEFDVAGTYYFSIAPDEYEYYIRTITLEDDFSATVNTTGVLPTDGTTLSGQTNYRLDNDWFAVNLNAGETLNVSLTTNQNGTRLRLHDTDGDVIDGASSGFDPELSYLAAESGAYYLSVDGAQQAYSASYEISASITGDDYAGDATTSGIVSDTAPVNGVLSANNDVDWLAVIVTAGQTVNLSATGVVNRLRIVTSDGEIQAAGFEFEDVNFLDYTAPEAGTYYVSLSHSEGAVGDYTLTTTFDQAPNPNTPDAPGSNSSQAALQSGDDRNVDFLGDIDWYRIDINANQTLSFTQYWEFGYLPSEFEFAVYNETGELVTTLLQQDGFSAPYYSHFFSETGIYFLEVDTAGVDVNTSYSLNGYVREDDYGQTNDQAGHLIIGTVLTATSEHLNDIDRFAISLNANDVIEISTTSTVVSYPPQYVFLNTLGEIILPDLGTENYTITQSGTYYIDVRDQANVERDYDVLVNLVSQLPIYGTSNSETITGTPSDDTINALSGNDFLRGLAGDDILNGGADKDWLRGGEGADVLDGGVGIDWADYSTSSSGITVNLGTNTGNGADAQGDSYISIERIFGSRFTDELTGDAAANYLRGHNGDDVLYGEAGNDYLQGDSGADVLNGGAGFDTAYYVSAVSGLTINLGDEAQNTGEAFGDSYTSIENITGSRFDDTIIGDDGDNYLRGYLGDDVIDGGEGNDTLRGEAGADTFVFEAGGGNDTVIDWVDADDFLDLSSFGFTDASDAIATAAQVGNNVVFTINGETITIEDTTTTDIMDNLII